MTIRTRLAVALCSAAAVLAALPACETAKSVVGQDAASKAMSALPQNIVNIGKDYLAKMGDMNKMLAGITDQASALKSIPGLDKITEPLSHITDQLNALSPELKNQVTAAFGDQLKGVNDMFAKQVQRLTGMSDVGPLLKSTLDKVKLFG